jgi:hypothetical protein
MYPEPEQMNRSEMIGSTAKNQQQDTDIAAQKYQQYLREYNIHRNKCINIIRKALQDIRDDLKQREQKRKHKSLSCNTQTRNRRPGTKHTCNTINHERQNTGIEKALYPSTHNNSRVHNTGTPRIKVEVCCAVDTLEVQSVNPRPTPLPNHNKQTNTFIVGTT